MNSVSTPLRPNRSEQSVSQYGVQTPMTHLRQAQPHATPVTNEIVDRNLPGEGSTGAPPQYDVSSTSFRSHQHTKTRAISSPSQSTFSGALHRISCFLVAHHRILILASIVTGHRGLQFTPQRSIMFGS